MSKMELSPEATKALADLVCRDDGETKYWIKQFMLAHDEIARLQTTIDKLVTAIMADDNWQDDWCVICHGHPGHDNTHGGNDCPMIELATNTRNDVAR